VGDAWYSNSNMSAAHWSHFYLLETISVPEFIMLSFAEVIKNMVVPH